MEYSIKEKIIHSLPQGLKSFIRRQVDLKKYDLQIRQKNNPFFGEPDTLVYSGSKYKLGIIIDPNQYHKYYIAACRDLKISYQLIDILKSTWMSDVIGAGCDGFLVWPSILNSTIKQAYDERLHILRDSLNMIVFPSLEETLIYENKKRMAYWLASNDVPHPMTWVFYDKDEAMSFMKKNKTYPIVFKTSFGAAASGVVIIRSPQKMQQLINVTFGRGFVSRRSSKSDKQRGFILFQSYLKSFDEWRMVRIGDSYFGYKKVKSGDFHSGSHVISYERPPLDLLEFTRITTNKGGFKSMGLDVFVDDQQQIFVNELQTVFGTTALSRAIKDKKELIGRYLYESDEWVFEKGEFFDNGFANLRVLELISQIENSRK